jgi:predicted molibdopterin-dependent oxidoreductase YjgC
VPNRRGVELAGFSAETEGLAVGDGGDGLDLLIVADSDVAAAHDEAAVARLRWAGFLVVLGWADTPLAAAADLVLPIAHHAETDGTFVNVEHRLQAFEQAFPPPGHVRPGVEVLADLLDRFEEGWRGATAATVFDRLAGELPAFAGTSWTTIPAGGVPLAVAGAAPGAEPTVAPEAPLRS